MVDPSIILGAQPVQIQSPAQAMGQYAQLRNLMGQGQLQQGQMQLQQQQIQGAGLENQQRQIQLNSEKALDDAYHSAFTQNPDGSVSFNRDAIGQHLAANGAGHLIPGVNKSLTDMEKSAADARKANADAATANADATGSTAASIRDAGYTPGAAILGVTHLLANKLITQDQASQFTAQIQSNPDPKAIQALIDPIIAASPKQQELANSKMSAQGSADRGTAALQNSNRLAGQQTLKDYAAQLGATTNGADYANVLNAMPHGLATQFPVADQWTPATSKKALQMGMSAAEIAADARATTDQNERARHDRATEGQGAARLDQGQQRIDNSQGGGGATPGAPQPTPGQQGTQDRFNTREVDQARRQLDQIHQQRTALGTALAAENGASYTDPKTGQPSKQDMDDTVRAGLQQQYTNLTNQGNRIMKQFGGANSGGRIGANEFGAAQGRQPAPPAAPQTTQPPAVAQPPQQSANQKLPDGGGKQLDQATAKQFLAAAGGDKAKARTLANAAHWKF